MNNFSVQNKVEYILPIWFFLLFFFVEISTTLKSILLILVLLSICLLPNVGLKLRTVLKTKWCQAGLFLFFVALLACFWGPATTAKKMSALKQYSKLLYIPFFVVGLNYSRSRQCAVIGFFCAMTCTALLSIGAFLNLFKGTNINFDHIFLNHIMTGFAMSFAAFLALWYTMNTPSKLKIGYLFLFALFTAQVLFINLGRTGYLSYALMLGPYALMSFRGKQSLYFLLGLGGLLIAAYTFSPTTKQGVEQAISDYHHYNQNKNNPVGWRMQFHNYASDLYKRHPWLGNGAASFSVLFYKDNPVPEFGREINEPHSMYWLVASEFGILGFAALLWFFISILLEFCTVQSWNTLAVIFIFSFMVVNLNDSMLFRSGSGYLFILFASYFLSQKQAIKTSQSFTIQESLIQHSRVTGL